MSQPSAEAFLKDVESHRMTVLSDSGVNRSLKFENPNCSNLHFFITTWPGHLCISGDMGTFVFARIHDMFLFFDGKEPQANMDYWSEKLIAQEASPITQSLTERYIWCCKAIVWAIQQFKGAKTSDITDAFDEERMDIIGPNGNTGEHYEVLK